MNAQPPIPPHTPEDTAGGHLRYLLTAYLFDNISEAGRREVEDHLVECAECRAELEELRATRALLEEALVPADGDATPYSFEARRLQRVLDASHERPWWRRHLIMKVVATAAMLTLSIVLLQSRHGLIPVERASAPSTRAGRDEKSTISLWEANPMRPETATRQETSTPPGAGSYGNRSGGKRRAPNSSLPRPTTIVDGDASGLMPPWKGARAHRKETADRERPSNLAPRLESTAGTFEGYGTKAGRGAADEAGRRRLEGSDSFYANDKDSPSRGTTLGVPPVTDSLAPYEKAESSGKAPANVGSTLDAKNERVGAGPVGNADDDSYTKPLPQQPNATAGVPPKWPRMQPATKEVAEADRLAARRKELLGHRITAYPGPIPARQKEEELVQTMKHSTTVDALEARSDRTERLQGDAGIAAGRSGKRDDALKGSDKESIESQLRIPTHYEPLPNESGTTAGLAAQTRVPTKSKAKEEVTRGRRENKNEPRDSGTVTNRYAHTQTTLKNGKVLIVGGSDERLSTPLDSAETFNSEVIREKSLSQAATAGPDAGFVGFNAIPSGAPTAFFLPPAAEQKIRAYLYYHQLDPSLTPQDFAARALRIPPPAVGDEGLGRDAFRARYGVNPFVDTDRDHLSTFAMDVDTASYQRARALLLAGQLPDPKSVRVEEFVNSFPHPGHADPDHAFSVFCDGGPSPFGAHGTDLLEITVKARDLRPDERRDAVLTFAVDTSGSMLLDDRLGLVKKALTGLLDSLRPEDRVAVVAYDSQAYLALPHTPARERDRILGALDSLTPGGGTNVEAGLDLAYRLADESFGPKALNRVIVCSDGVATSGARSADEVLKKVRVFAQRGIYLSVVGFGRERYDDAFLEKLADQGNGNYAYVDGSASAEKVFRSNLPATLQVLARDAKIQVDFNPLTVARYRLIGYENRDIRDQDFRNDAVDAGEVGPGSTVTALYEVERRPASHGDLGRIYLRYHDTTTSRVEELDFPLSPGIVQPTLEKTTDRFRFIASVAEFAELLRGSYWARDGSYADVIRVLSGVSAPYLSKPECREVLLLATVAQGLTFQPLLHR